MEENSPLQEYKCHASHFYLSLSNHFLIFSFTPLCLISSSLTTTSDCIFSCFYFWCGFSLHVYTFFFHFFFKNCECTLSSRDQGLKISNLHSYKPMESSFPFCKTLLILGGPFLLRPSSVFCYVHYKAMLGFHVHSCPSVIYLETEPWICWRMKTVHAGRELGCSVASTFPWISIWKVCPFSQPASVYSM